MKQRPLNFNRTIVELKHGFGVVDHVGECILIEP